MLSKPITVVGIDTETTGLKQEDGHRIIEIAMSIYRTDDGVSFRKVGSTWVQRINPLRAIDPGAQAVHGIGLADLRGEPEWEEVAPKIAKILKAADLVVCHNAQFDCPFIAMELVRIGLDLPQFDVFCTMLNGRSLTAMGKVPNLGELCFAMGVDYDASAAHAADYDTDRMMECFVRGVSWGTFKPDLFQVPVLQEAC